MKPPKVIKEANVTISIKGLALSHHKRNWETRFLRHVQGHNLRLIVKKNGEEIFSSRIDDDERISITTNKAKEIPTRCEAGNDNDLSHLVDFNSPDMCGDNLKFNDKPMTFLSTSDACFYAKTISGKQYTVCKNGKSLFTRRVGVITGGDIVSLDETKISFANSPDKNITLLAETGVIYEIIFDNDCQTPPKSGESDFDRFSDVIDYEDKFTLTTPDVSGYMDPEDGEDDSGKDPPCTSGLGG